MLVRRFIRCILLRRKNKVFKKANYAQPTFVGIDPQLSEPRFLTKNCASDAKLDGKKQARNFFDRHNTELANW